MSLAAKRARLARFQDALAQILMEVPAQTAFAKDPVAFAKPYRLGPLEPMLTRLAAPDAGYFSSRRVIDRFSYLQSDVARSVAALENSGGLAATYFAACPYAYDEPAKEVAQLAAWARRNTHGPVRDVIRLETAAYAMMQKAYRAPRPASGFKRASGVKILVLDHDPDAIVDGRLDEAEPGRYTVALVREEDDVEVYRLDEAALALLANLTAPQRAGLSATRLAKVARDLRARGILCPKRQA